MIDVKCNPGLFHASQAAAAIGGALVLMPDEYGDWNDYAAKHGIDTVSRILLDAVAPPMEPEYDSPPEEYYDVIEQTNPLDLIRPMGHNGAGEYVFFPRTEGVIVSLTASAMGRIQNLYRLAPREFWETHFGVAGEKVSDSSICSLASAALMAECQRKGVFRSETVRGVGVWREGDAAVVNCGDQVYTLPEGPSCDPSDFVGKNIYTSGPSVVDMDVDPLSNAQANELREICKQLSWAKPQFADLLAGWCVVAPIGGALRWRPHAVVTGPKGSGKSTVHDLIVKNVVGDIGIYNAGLTTEAKVRRDIGESSRPYILDEFESETQSQRTNTEKILTLARLSSSGASAGNAYENFTLRSCFFFAAINPRIEHGADKDRITMLTLVPDTKSPPEKFIELEHRIITTLTPEYGKRLFRRTVENLDALLANIDTFTIEAAKVLGSRRDGDQVGPLIAGAFSLTSRKKVTREEAAAWMARQDWDWHVAAKDVPDSEKLMQYIMTARARYDVDGSSRESSIGELVARAADKGGMLCDASTDALKQYGIKVADGKLFIANNSPRLKELLDKTPWAVWRTTLSDFKGADNYGNKTVRFMAGLTSKVTTVPLDAILGRDDVGVEEIDFE